NLEHQSCGRPQDHGRTQREARLDRGAAERVCEPLLDKVRDREREMAAGLERGHQEADRTMVVTSNAPAQRAEGVGLRKANLDDKLVKPRLYPDIIIAAKDNIGSLSQ